MFVGFAKDLVVGVWVGNDDNTPNPGLSGGGVPARVWKDFMSRAIPGAAIPVPAPANPEPVLVLDENGMEGSADLGPVELGISVGENGFSVSAEPSEDEPLRPRPKSRRCRARTSRFSPTSRAERAVAASERRLPLT